MLETVKVLRLSGRRHVYIFLLPLTPGHLIPGTWNIAHTVSSISFLSTSK